MSAQSDRYLSAIVRYLEKFPNVSNIAKAVEALKAASHTMIGASSTTNGVSGFVPAPNKLDHEKFLCADGTWKSVITSVSQTRVTSRKMDSTGTDFSMFLIGDSDKETTYLTEVKKAVDAKIVQLSETDSDGKMTKSTQLIIGSEKTTGKLNLHAMGTTLSVSIVPPSSLSSNSSNIEVVLPNCAGNLVVDTKLNELIASKATKFNNATTFANNMTTNANVLLSNQLMIYENANTKRIEIGPNVNTTGNKFLQIISPSINAYIRNTTNTPANLQLNINGGNVVLGAIKSGYKNNIFLNTSTVITHRSTAHHTLRFINNAYKNGSVMFRYSDTGDFYLLLSESNNNEAIYTSSRPLTVKSNGICNINGNAETATRAVHTKDGLPIAPMGPKTTVEHDIVKVNTIRSQKQLDDKPLTGTMNNINVNSYGDINVQGKLKADVTGLDNSDTIRSSFNIDIGTQSYYYRPIIIAGSAPSYNNVTLTGSVWIQYET